MIDELKHIWEVCFDDSEAYTDLYFSHVYAPENTLVHTVAGRAVAMLSLLPATLVTPAGTRKARYVYAVATLPAFRGKGFSRQLLAQADARMRAEGCELAVVMPASDTLVGFYAQQGFVPAFSRRAVWLPLFPTHTGSTRSFLNGIPLGDTDDELQMLAALRERFFTANGGCFVRWDTGILSYAIRECRLASGGAFYFPDCGAGDGYIIVERRGDTVVVQEMAVAPSLAEHLPAFLQQRYADSEAIIFHLSASSSLWSRRGVIEPTAMCKWFSPPCNLSGGHFGLMGG
ncbi:MAG: GNAT family N-acetyltransferase [Prevotellaceae bacterium]|jgi:predicted acetyltransferase|nr:GNAT family N-acetyltransferase [Prevotellaceae bacterium]